MSGSERYLPQPAAAALDRLRNEDQTPILAYGPVLEIAFPASGTRRDVQHGLGAIPTGFITIATQGGNVQAYDLVNWTTSLAFLVADAANMRVRGFFIVTETPTNA